MAELREIADRLAIRALVDEYALGADRRDLARFAAVFLDTATLTGAEFRYEGVDQISTIPEKLARYSRTLHVIANHVVALDGDTATGETYCVAHHLSADDGTERDRVMYIRYHDAYVRTEGGWRITARRLEVEWVENRPVTIR